MGDLYWDFVASNKNSIIHILYSLCFWLILDDRWQLTISRIIPKRYTLKTNTSDCYTITFGDGISRYLLHVWSVITCFPNVHVVMFTYGALSLNTPWTDAFYYETLWQVFKLDAILTRVYASIRNMCTPCSDFLQTSDELLLSSLSILQAAPSTWG